MGMKIDRKYLKTAARVAERQGGVITTRQADRLGISRDVRRRLVDEGSWRRITQGVYALGADSWQQRAWAGILIGGPDAVLGYESALHLWDLGPAPGQLTVFVGRHAGFPNDDRWKFIRGTRQGYGHPPRTSLYQAIIDVGQRWPADELTSLLGAAVTGRKVTTEHLRIELDSRTRHSQRHLMAVLITDVANGTTTVLESRYHQLVEKAHGLPIPRRQVSPVGRYRVDNWYDRFKLIVEVDGRATHTGLAASVDMERDNFHMSYGISTLRFTWSHVVQTPCQTARTVAQALARAGWSGQLRPCRDCK